MAPLQALWTHGVFRFLVFLPVDKRVLLLLVPAVCGKPLCDRLKKIQPRAGPNDRGLQFTFAACLASGAWRDVSTPAAPEKQKAATGKQEKQSKSVQFKGVYSAS